MSIKFSRRICCISRNLRYLSPSVHLNYMRAFYCSVQEGRDWWQIYHERKKKIYDHPRYTETRSDAVFANNEISLGDIDIYGFDYDYTLATYKPALHNLIYKLGAKALVQNVKYPEDILNLTYRDDFAVRGCHYDVRKGLLMKLDSFHNIQLGTVYKGTIKLSDEDVKAQYKGTHVSLEDMNSFYGTGPQMCQLIDLFAPPEMILLTNITNFFLENNIPYDPEYVFHDVRTTVQGLHNSGAIHSAIMQDLDKYLDKGSEVKALLTSLVEKGKKLFLITNSGFPFVDAGMSYMIGEDWRDLFHVIITKARKPKFFNESTRPFRIYDPATQNESYERVLQLSRGRVYQQGNIYLLRQMTGWYSFNVLYFGDHVYSDLADPSLKFGWRTGAIIPELEREIMTANNSEYQTAVNWLCELQNLIEMCQMDKTQDTTEVRRKWLEERNELRVFTKSLYNPHFGSLFRTYHNPTYFSRRLARFADIYMSSVVNLMQYSTDHTFYPRRMALPHEPHTIEH